MEVNARRFARRILAIHVLLLVLVLAAVGLAARQIYDAGRAEVLAEAQARQRQLAVQTARGVENHYASILNDMDLLRRADGDEGTEKAVDRRGATETPDQRALNRTLSATARTPLAGQVIGGVMWKQLDGRVKLLFACDRVTADRPATPGPANATDGPRDPASTRSARGRTPVGGWVSPR